MPFCRFSNKQKTKSFIAYTSHFGPTWSNALCFDNLLCPFGILIKLLYGYESQSRAKIDSAYK